MIILVSSKLQNQKNFPLSLSAQIKTYKCVAAEMYVDFPATTWLKGIMKLIRKTNKIIYNIQIE